MSTNLAITAHLAFCPTPFTTAITGIYNGLFYEERRRGAVAQRRAHHPDH